MLVFKKDTTQSNIQSFGPLDVIGEHSPERNKVFFIYVPKQSERHMQEIAA